MLQNSKWLAPRETVSFVSSRPQLRVSGKQNCYFLWGQSSNAYCFVLQECVAILMNLLAECVNVMSKEDIKTYQSNLFTLYLEALDFRAHHDQEASDGKLLGIKSKAEP